MSLHRNDAFLIYELCPHLQRWMRLRVTGKLMCETCGTYVCKRTTLFPTLLAIAFIQVTPCTLFNKRGMGRISKFGVRSRILSCGLYGIISCNEIPPRATLGGVYLGLALSPGSLEKESLGMTVCACANPYQQYIVSSFSLKKGIVIGA